MPLPHRKKNGKLTAPQATTGTCVHPVHRTAFAEPGPPLLVVCLLGDVQSLGAMPVRERWKLIDCETRAAVVAVMPALKEALSGYPPGTLEAKEQHQLLLPQPLWQQQHRQSRLQSLFPRRMLARMMTQS